MRGRKFKNPWSLMVVTRYGEKQVTIRYCGTDKGSNVSREAFDHWFENGSCKWIEDLDQVKDNSIKVKMHEV